MNKLFLHNSYKLRKCSAKISAKRAKIFLFSQWVRCYCFSFCQGKGNGTDVQTTYRQQCVSYMPELGEMGCKTEMTYNGIETEICVCHSMLCNSAAHLIDDVNLVLLLFGTTAGLFVANHKFF